MRTKDIKVVLFWAFAFAACSAYADMIVPQVHELHRIGYEVFIYLAGSIAGSALVLRLAKKDWRKSGVWKRWEEWDELGEAAAIAIKRRIDEVKPTFMDAVRRAYGKVDGLLATGWQYDLVLSALEHDEHLMSRCKGIPIECLMSVAASGLKEEIDARLAIVATDLKRVFDAEYDAAAAEWLRKDALERERRTRAYNSLWGRIRQCFSSSYRKESFFWRYITHRECDWRIKRSFCSLWDGLCGSLLDSVLEQNEVLKNRCKGVERQPLIKAMSKTCPDGYVGAAYWKREHQSKENKVFIDGDDMIDIDEIVDGIRRAQEEQEKEREWKELRQEALEKWKKAGNWTLHVNDEGREFDCPIDKPTLLVGRSFRSDVRVRCISVSGRHLEVLSTPEELKVKVLSSRGATAINQKELLNGEAVSVSSGDVIVLGNGVKIVVTGKGHGGKNNE